MSDLVRISKFLSLVLRHRPEKIGLDLDENGWTSISELIEKARSAKVFFTREILTEVVETNDKKRFVVSEDGLRIRAAQGHSIEIDLDLAPQPPPHTLFHGTASSAISSIRSQGLVRGRRHHVHLSTNEETAVKVGQRHGKPVVLVVRSGEMHEAGIEFFVSDNGVWLTETVPTKYIDFPVE